MKKKTLFIANFDDFFPFEAKKCMDLGPRCLWLAREKGDAVLLYMPPREDYLEYVAQIKGFMPKVYYPKTLTEDKRLLASVVSDSVLISDMSRGVNGGQVDPLYQTPVVLRLARRLGVSNRWKSRQEAIKGGAVDYLNDKGVFMKACQSLGLPVHPFSFICKDKQDIEIRIKALAALGTTNVIVKATRSAGGLRNQTVNTSGGFDSFDYWDAPSIVEPVIEVDQHFSVYGEVFASGKVVIGGVTLRHVDNFESLGATLPHPGLPELLEAQIKSGARLYAKRAIKPKRVHTPFDIDGSIRAKTIYFWETNVRRYATQIQEQVGTSLGYTITRSNEAFPIARGASLTEVREWATWCEKRHPEIRVIITLPPSVEKGTMGVCICGWEHSKVQAAYDELMQLSKVEAVND